MKNVKSTSLIIVVLFLLTAALLAGCGTDEAVAPASDAMDLSALPGTVDVAMTASLQSRPDVLLLDVRETWEYDEGHIPGITHLPMGDVPNRLSEIPRDVTVIVTCRSGNRSGQVTDYLRERGYDNVHNMAGGILAWQAAGYPVE